MALTVERLRQVVHYDQQTGRFVRRNSWAKAGNSLDERGRRRINIDGHTYCADRLAWWWVNGALPSHRLRHINGDKSDNRICNLVEDLGEPDPAAFLVQYIRTIEPELLRT